jgi:hypothetical protein
MYLNEQGINYRVKPYLTNRRIPVGTYGGVRG